MKYGFDWVSYRSNSLLLTVYKTTSTKLIFLPQLQSMWKRETDLMNSMCQYWLCCYNGRHCSVLMIAWIWINICVCPYLGVTWERRRSRCWVGPASPAITKSLLRKHPSNRLPYQNSYLKYEENNSIWAINNILKYMYILFFIVYH